MLRITEARPTAGTSILRLVGRVIGPWVGELGQACEEALSSARALTLDLAEVSFVDEHGVALIRALAKREVALVNCSPFIAERLSERG